MNEIASNQRGNVRQRVVVLGAFVATLLALIGVSLASLGADGTANGPGTSPLGAGPGGRLVVHEIGRLPQPLQGAATATSGKDLLLAGGIDQGGTPLSLVVRASSSGSAQVEGHLPSRMSGVALASVGGNSYVFAGRTILELQGGRTRPGPRLPRNVTGGAAVTAAGAAFLIGGYGSGHPLSTVIAWQPGGRPHVTAHLPVAVRYPAAVTVGTKVLIIGGTVRGVASNQILSFDPARHRVRRIGKLPVALTHASAAALGGTVYLVGGRSSKLNSQTRAIYAIDPRTAKVRFAGSLPAQLSDASLAAADGRLLLAGGVDRAGRVHDRMFAIS
ncbi:MAG: hypothetical protein NVSMB51_14350 [Solirubrobacteraceae bacterium]